MSSLGGRVVIITGAASGIGRATALLAAQEGASIGAIDVDTAGLHSVVDAARRDGGHIAGRVTDVSDVADLTTSIASLVEELGILHGVFANAGILPPPVPSQAIDWTEWRRVLDVNLTGAISTIVASLPFVVEGGSLLVNGSSMAIRPREERLAYVAAKAGLHAAARALALEVAPRQIRVNVIAPGLTDTPMVRRIPGHIESGLPSVPLGELVPAQEVAAMAIYLLSDAAKHLTGAVVSVDGGRSAG
jgi:NAD(P)-dependent dehydrogenase (short-subunit alcohol dehydrogenase family)